MPNQASDRQQRWPTNVGQYRRQTEETAEDHSEHLRRVLTMLGQIQEAAFEDPKLVYELAIRAQRDIALTIAALSDIRSWMVQAARGRARDKESNGA